MFIQTKKISRICATALLLLLLPASGLFAQSQGRIIMTVQNEKGEAVPGVKVQVTCPENSRFGEELVTDKKGRAKLLVTDATKAYRVQIEFEGYHPVDRTVQPEFTKAVRELIELRPRTVAPKKVEKVQTGGVMSRAGKAFNEGLEALRIGDLVVAEARLTEAAERNPKMVPAHQALARLYLQRKEYELALASSQRLLELEPENAQGIRSLYEAHLGLGNDAEAEKAFDALAKVDTAGDAPAMVFNEGVAALRSGDQATAKVKFLRALELKEDLVPAWVAVARIYLLEGNAEEAARASEAALALEPQQLDALALRYEAYRVLGDTEKSAAAFDALSGADPERVAQLLLEGGVDRFNAGDVAGAASQLEQSLELDPDLAQSHYRLGLCYLSLGESEKAKERLQRFLELAPDDPEAATAKEMLGFLQ